MTNKVEKIDYNYTECGLSNVIIAGMPVIRDDAGELIIRIPHVGYLHASIMFELASKDNSLSPSELKFVRTEMGLTQSQLSELIRKDNQTIGRWERGEHPIDETAEMLIRLLCFNHLEDISFITRCDESDGMPKNQSLSIASLSQMCVQSANDRPIAFEMAGNGQYRLRA